MFKREKPTFLSPEEEKKQDARIWQDLRMHEEARQFKEEREAAKRKEQEEADQVLREQERLESELSHMEGGLKGQFARTSNELQRDNLSDSRKDVLEKRLDEYQRKIDIVTKDKEFLTKSINDTYWRSVSEPQEPRLSSKLWNILRK